MWIFHHGHLRECDHRNHDEEVGCRNKSCYQIRHQYRQVCYFRKTGTTRARFPVCDCFSNVCLTHMDGTENHSRNDLIPLVRLRIRCDHSRNRMSTQDTYLRNANQVCKARKPRSYCSLMFEHLMVDCSALLNRSRTLLDSRPATVGDRSPV